MPDTSATLRICANCGQPLALTGPEPTPLLITRYPSIHNPDSCVASLLCSWRCLAQWARALAAQEDGMPQ